jgi:hypothetical protein
MSLIVNFQRLDLSALEDVKHPMYAYAKEYDEGIRHLLELYPEKKIKFTRVGYPRMVTYNDPLTGREAQVPEDVPPLRLSLRANVKHPKRGSEQWGVCLGAPHPLPGGLWDIGGKLDTKTKQIEGNLIIDLVDQPDLAFFVYYKSPLVRGGHLKVDDPREETKQKADKKRHALELETAIWQTLSDEEQLRKLASAWGIENVKEKLADDVRFDLERVLKENDQKKKKDPTIKGTKEFLEEMKITDYVRLSAFIRQMLDDSMIQWNADGRYKVGDKTIVQVPSNEVKNKFAWLCNYFASPNNKDRLAELFKDLINKEYLDSLTDPKDFRYIANVMGLEGYFNKNTEQVKQMVYDTFVI